MTERTDADILKEALQRYARNTKDGAVKVHRALQAFGIERLSDLKPEQYGALIRALPPA